MPRRLIGRLLAAAVPGAPAAALLVLAPPTRLAAAWTAGLRAHDGGTALLLATAGAVAWAVVAWLLLGLAAAALGALPGVIGTSAQRISRRVTPALVRSLLSGGTAVGLALAPALLPIAAEAAPSCAPTATAGLPSLDRPAIACPVPSTTPSTLRPPSATPAPSRPSAAPPSTTPRSTTPSNPLPVSRPPVATRPGAPRPSGAGHLVRTGDSLWSLARSELRADGRPAPDAAIARRWPAWWQANRAEIGPDPDLLHPGELLHAPATHIDQEAS